MVVVNTDERPNDRRNPPMSEPSLSASGTARYGVLLGAIIVQLILGTVYGYSIFWEPLSAEIFPPVVTEAQVSEMTAAGQDVAAYAIAPDEATAKQLRTEHQAYLKYAFSICILSFAVVMVIAGRIQDVIGPRSTALIGAVLMGVGFFIAGFMDNVLVFYLAHAAFTGAVAIILLMLFHAIFAKANREQMPILQYVPMGIVTASVVAGIVLAGQYGDRLTSLNKLFVLWGTVGFLAGAGIGFAYVCPIAALIKWFPNKKGLVSGIAVAGFGFGAYLFTNKQIGASLYIAEHGIRQFFLVHAAVCLVGVTVGAMLLANPPGVAARAANAGGDSTWQDTLRQPRFYVLWLMFFSGAMAGLMVIGILKPFAGEQLGDVQKGFAAVGYLAIFNAVGRIVWGFVSDKIGRTGAFVLMFLFQAVMLFLLISMKTQVSIAVASSIVGFNFGGNFALFPSATADLFGAKNLGANYGWVFTSYGIAGVVGIAAGNTAKEMTGSYASAFNIAAVLCLVSAGLAIGLALQQKKRVAAA